MDFNYYIYQHLQQVYSSLWTSSPFGASSRTCVRSTENRGRQLQRGSQNHWLGFGKFRKHTKSALHATTGRGPSSLSGPPGMFHIYTQPWLLLWHTLFLFLRRWNRPRRKCKWSGRSGERWATLMRACFKKLLFSRLYLVKQGMKSWDASLREQAGALFCEGRHKADMCVCALIAALCVCVARRFFQFVLAGVFGDPAMLAVISGRESVTTNLAKLCLFQSIRCSQRMAPYRVNCFGRKKKM